MITMIRNLKFLTFTCHDIIFSLRIRWGDGYTWSNTTARPQNYVLTHQYAASGTYTLQIAIFKVNSGYGVGYYPKVVVP